MGQDLDLDAAVRADMTRMRDVEALANIVIDSSGLSPQQICVVLCLESLQLD